jgi:hypothetical protein
MDEIIGYEFASRNLQSRSRGKELIMKLILTANKK